MKQSLRKKSDWIRKIGFLIVIICVFTACTENNSADNIALIEKYVAAVETNDYEAMDALLAENFLGYGPSYTDSTNRIAALASWKENIENLYESVSYEHLQIVAFSITSGSNKGDWVANWAEVKIKYKDGRGPISILANSNYKIENGKIVKSYTFYNEADALRQLGYSFSTTNFKN